MVQHPDQEISRGILKKHLLLMLASSRISLNVDQDSDHEARNVEQFEDGDFLALRPHYDRRTHAHLTSRFSSKGNFSRVKIFVIWKLLLGEHEKRMSR